MRHHITILVLTMCILVKGASDSRVKRQSSSSDHIEGDKKLHAEETKEEISPKTSERSYGLSSSDSREDSKSDYPKPDTPDNTYKSSNKDYDDHGDNAGKASEPYDYSSASDDSTMPKESRNSKETDYDIPYSDSKDMKDSDPAKQFHKEISDESYKNRNERDDYPNSSEEYNSHPSSNTGKGGGRSNHPYDSTETRHYDNDKSAVPSYHSTSRQSKDFYPNDGKADTDRSTEDKTAGDSYYPNSDNSEEMSSHGSSKPSSLPSSSSFFDPHDRTNEHKSVVSEKSSNSYPNYSSRSSDPYNKKKPDDKASYRKLSSDYDDSGDHSKEGYQGHSSSEDSRPNDPSRYMHGHEGYQYYDKPSSSEEEKSSSYPALHLKHGPVSSEDRSQVIPPPKAFRESVTAASVKVDAETVSYKREQSEDGQKGAGSMKLETKAKRHYDNYYHPYKTTTPPPIPGVAGVDYPILAAPPATGFNCSRHKLAGYYADMAAQCQVFYICQADGRQDAFLCPNGTIFNQQYLVCDWWYNVNCGKSAEHYKVNSKLYVAASSKVAKSADTKKDGKENSGKDKRSSGTVTRIQAVGYDKNDKSLNTYAYQEVTEGVRGGKNYAYDY